MPSIERHDLATDLRTRRPAPVSVPNVDNPTHLTNPLWRNSTPRHGWVMKQSRAQQRVMGRALSRLDKKTLSIDSLPTWCHPAGDECGTRLRTNPELSALPPENPSDTLSYAARDRAFQGGRGQDGNR